MRSQRHLTNLGRLEIERRILSRQDQVFVANLVSGEGGYHRRVDAGHEFGKLIGDGSAALPPSRISVVSTSYPDSPSRERTALIWVSGSKTPEIDTRAKAPSSTCSMGTAEDSVAVTTASRSVTFSSCRRNCHIPKKTKAVIVTTTSAWPISQRGRRNVERTRGMVRTASRFPFPVSSFPNRLAGSFRERGTGNRKRRIRESADGVG